MTIHTRTLLGLALCLLAPLTTGCASEQALRISLDDRDALVQNLRDEKIALKRELQMVSLERDNLQVQLLEASATRAEGATLESTMQFPELADQGISVARRGDSIVFTIPSKITFASGKAELSSEGQRALMSVAQRLKSEFSSDVFFHVEGHTDSDRISRSQFKSNRELSLARAMAVLDFLVTQGKVEDKRFVLAGHGPHRPIASNSTEDGKARNRRVELIVRATE
jgi:chemotaxis protein MotB